MDGLFVDNKSCLCLITPIYCGEHKEEWHIHRADEDNFDGYDGTIKRLRMSSKYIQMSLCSEHAQGVFDGKDCITWDDGAKWRRLRVSYDQIQTLRYRPYAPLSLHLIHLLYNLMLYLYQRCKKQMML